MNIQIRYLGHSCVEIIGKHHILIDPDFTRRPKEGVEYILVSHAHRDHIARIAEIPSGIVIASEDVCRVASNLGVSENRLIHASVGDHIGNIQILPGYSMSEGLIYKALYFLYRRHLPDPGGTPLSFLIEDTVSVLHIGDAHKFELKINPDVLCVPWRTTPFGSSNYKKHILTMINKISPKYIIPIHYDLTGMEANPKELSRKVNSKVLLGKGWHMFDE